MKKGLLTLALALLAVCGVSAAVKTANSLTVKSSEILPPPVNERLVKRQAPTVSKTVKTTPAPQTRADEDGWTSLGTGYYREDIMASMYTNVENSMYEVEIQENNDVSGYFRLVNPYGPAYPYYSYNESDYTAQDWYLEIHAEDPNAVYIDLQNLGVDWGYGLTYVYSAASGKLQNGVITFPTRGLGAQDDDEDGPFAVNRNGAFAVVLPGYELAEETWTERYIGTYTYSLLWRADEDGNPLDVPGYTLYQSDEEPTRWKITDWGGVGVDFVFTWDQETNDVMVADQTTGYTHSQYGEVYVDDLVDYVGSTQYGGPSYYEDGVFYFALIYYVSAGNFGYGYGETFTITEDLAAALNTATAGTWSVSGSGADRTLRIAGTDAEAAIYDITGHLVYRGTDRAINVPAAGVYMVRIGAETKRAIIK